MATAVFEFVGGAIGTTIGGPLGGQIGSWIGAAVGGYVDSMIVASLTAPDPPRLADLNVQVSTYGKPMALLLGEEVRVAGNVIWTTGLVERKEGGKGGPPGSEHYTYSTSVAVALADCVGMDGLERVVKVWANGKLIYDETLSGVEYPALPATDIDQGYTVTKAAHNRMSVFTSLVFHPGSMVQDPDPTIELNEGADNTPRYKGTCYVVINGLQLADFGNRLPNLEFLVQPRTGDTVGEACHRLIERCGIAPESVSNSSLHMTLRGYAIGNMANGLGALQPLSLAYSFDLAEVWGSLRLQPRGTSVHGVVSIGEMGARDVRSSREEPIRFPRTPETTLPHMASVSFSNPARDYQKDSQAAHRSSGNSNAKAHADSPIVLETDEGRQLADRVLWEAWTSRQLASTTVDDRWLGMEPGRAYLFETNLGYVRAKVVDKTRGANGVHKVQVRKDRPVVYQSTAPGAEVPAAENAVTFSGDTTWQPLDIPILREQDDDSGFYWAALGQEDGWRGFDLQRSVDGSTYSSAATNGAETAMGDISGTVPDGPSHVPDEETTITVTLDDDQALESISEAEWLAGGNLAWIGDAAGADGELVNFRTATMTAPGVYELTGLLRGRYGTEYATGAHGAGERFVLIGTTGMGRNDFGQSDWNKSRDYKPVSVLQAIADVTAVPFTNTGEGKRPYSPVHFEGERDGSDNLTISWTRRSRIPAPGVGNGNVALGESSELYELDILDGADVVRTITVTTNEASYTAAEQTADGLTPGDPVEGIAYQISDSRGRGRPAAFTV